MKMGFICSDIDIPLFGDEGSSIHIRDFTDAFVDLGHEVFVICPWLGEKRISTKGKVYQFEPRGLNAMGWNALEKEPIIRNNNLERDLRSVAYNFWLQDEGSSIIEREKPDFLYERYSLFGWAGIELARRHDIPLIMEVNDPLCREQAGYEKFTLTVTAERMEREIICNADAIIAISKWIRDWVLSLGVNEKAVHLVPNGVSFDLFASEKSGDAVRRLYNLDSKKVIGFLGSFQRWHDVEGLLYAFSRVYESDHKLRLLLVGDGDQRENLEGLVHDRGLGSAVVFAGRIEHELVPEYIAAMDIAVAPYDWPEDFYGSPLKVFEYMAAGKPTVAAAIGQIEEVVEHGRTGWLYPSGNRDKLAESLASLLGSPDLCEAMGGAAKQKILSNYSWNAVACKAANLAEALIRCSQPVLK